MNEQQAFSDLLARMQSQDNGLKNAAETEYYAFRDDVSRRDAFLRLLVTECIRHSPNKDFAVVLLKMVFQNKGNEFAKL